jgi:hypothetical protein
MRTTMNISDGLSRELREHAGRYVPEALLNGMIVPDANLCPTPICTEN